MDGSVNIGSFRHKIQVFYESVQTVSEMGSNETTLSSYYAYANVNQIDSKQSVYLGLNQDTLAYSVEFRVQNTFRPVKIVFENLEMIVISTKIDKLNRFIYLIAKYNR